MAKVTLTMTVTAIGQITEESDRDVPGTYLADVPKVAYDRSKADACDLALDAFHQKVSIAEVDDFKVVVTGPGGERLVGNETWDGISGVYASLEGKVS